MDRNEVLQQFTDIGAGCCKEFEHEVTLYDSKIGPEGEDQKEGVVKCMIKCLEFDDCGYVTYGWDGSAQCHVVSSKHSCSSLDKDFTSCGPEGGASGVHVYTLTKVAKEIAEKDCGIKSPIDWRCYMIMNSDVGDICAASSTPFHCASMHYIRNVIFGTDKHQNCNCDKVICLAVAPFVFIAMSLPKHTYVRSRLHISLQKCKRP